MSLVKEPGEWTYDVWVTLFGGEAISRGDLCTVHGLLRLQQLPGVGPARAVRLAERFGDWSQLQDAPEQELRSILGAASMKVYAALPAVGVPAPFPDSVKAVCCFDEAWPRWMADVSSPPAVLFFVGTLPNDESIAIVGTRNPTQFGRSVVDKVVEALADRPVSGVVSGLALGIDASAHEAALRCDVPTWAFLGGGVDTPTPKQHRDLARKILDRGGGLISEQLPGTEPNPQRLVARNRLQSASSRAVLVAQCGVPSGTLHTARFAIEQGRRLVVPRPRAPWDAEQESAGNMALTDPHGCKPAVIQATGALARVVSGRKPLANLVLDGAEDISRIWE